MIILFIIFKLLSGAKNKRKRTVKRTTSTARNRMPDPAKMQRDADRIRREQFKRIQAEQDIIHYTQVKRDLMTAYNASGAAQGDSEKAIRKRIQYDNAIRTVEKKIEKAAFDSKRTG